MLAERTLDHGISFTTNVALATNPLDRNTTPYHTDLNLYHIFISIIKNIIRVFNII